MKKFAILFVLSYLVAGGVAHGATYYVAKTGNSGHTCAQAQSTSTPRLTISGGAACLTPGDTLLVRAGTYDDALINNIPSGTSWSSTVRIATYPGEIVWMRPSSGEFVMYLAMTQQYIELDGINMDATGTSLGAPVKIESWSGGNAHHIRIKNAEIISGSDGIPNQGTDGGPQAIIASGARAGTIGGNEFINLKMHGGGDPGDFSYSFYLQSSDNLIEGCNLYETSGAGIQIYNGYGYSPNNNIIRNNTIHDISRSPDTRVWGIVMGTGSGNKVYNNLIYNIGGSTGGGINVYSGSATEIYNNTIFNGATAGIVIDPNGSGTVVRNNISYQNAGGNFVNNGSSTTASNNLFTANPMFTNASGGNFQLQAGSPAIDTGTAVAIATDMIGQPRPQGAAFDLGAYESGTGSQAPTSPTGLRIVSTAP